MIIFFKNVTLTDDLELGTTENVLQKGIHMCNIKAVSLTIQKLWQMLRFFADKQTDKLTGHIYMCP